MPAYPASTAAPTASRTCAHEMSNGSRRRSICNGSTLGDGVPGLDLAEVLHAELRRAGSLVSTVVRVEHERDVVAGVDAVGDRPGEPVAAGEHGAAVGTGTPVDVLELVDLVAGLGTE